MGTDIAAVDPVAPTPRCPVMVRVATPADLPFIDSLQKQHAKQVGWMPTAQLEGKVRIGHSRLFLSLFLSCAP